MIDYGIQNNITLDIVASRNVLEHIYKLRTFYQKLFDSGLTKVCYATTTANYHNPAMRIKHHFYHAKVERTIYRNQRQVAIKELVPEISSTDLSKLVEITRGRAFADFTKAVNLYLEKKEIPAVEFLGTNTCDCKNGVWAEDLITRKNYFSIIETTGFSAKYSAGFWDTHYKYWLVNIITNVLNRLIKMAGNKGYWFSPFVNIVAVKK